MSKKGKVYLVGAGIGDEKNITVRGMELLKEADVIVYDKLLNQRLLNKEVLGGDKEYINVGKQASNHLMPQELINKLLAEKAGEGKKVVRLKGGDPYIFGRGGEEAAALWEEGIDFEVVPGVTAGIAGLCFAGIPATHRDCNTSLHFITGHLKTEDSLDYETLSKLQGTLVFYMGLTNLENITQGLRNHGMERTTPCAVISQGGYVAQEVICKNLDEITEEVKKRAVKSPALIVVGKVVALREKLNFFENRPLFQKNIVVTRAGHQQSTLSQGLRELGANVTELPTIKIEPIDKELLKKIQENIENYTHLIFTSSNSVEIFMDTLLEWRDMRALGHIQIYAIGEGTDRALNKYCLKADYIPTKAVAEVFCQEIREKLQKNHRVLIPRGKQARGVLKEGLSQICQVDEAVIYDTVSTTWTKEEINDLKEMKIDYITFTSGSTVNNFVSLGGKDLLTLWEGAKLISIGPITSKTITENGLTVYKESKVSTIDGLIKTIID